MPDECPQDFLCRSNHQQAVFALLLFSVQADRGPRLPFRRSVNRAYTAAVDFNCQFVQIGFAKHLIPNFP